MQGCYPQGHTGIVLGNIEQDEVDNIEENSIISDVNKILPGLLKYFGWFSLYVREHMSGSLQLFDSLPRLHNPAQESVAETNPGEDISLWHYGLTSVTVTIAIKGRAIKATRQHLSFNRLVP